MSLYSKSSISSSGDGLHRHRTLLRASMLLVLAACGQRYDMGTLASEVGQAEPSTAGSGPTDVSGGGVQSTNGIATRLVSSDADADVWIDDSTGCSNAEAALGDVDGDGFDDWTSPRGLIFNVCYGQPRPSDGVIRSGATQSSPLEWPEHLRAATWSSAAGDVDGDGHADVFVGMQLGEDDDPALTARGFLWYGAAERPSRAVPLESDAVTIDARELADAAGVTDASERTMVLVGLGDLDGDGYADFAASTAPAYGYREHGEVVTYLVYGRPERWAANGSTLASAAHFVGPSNSPVWPAANPVGDVNGDGFGDLIATADGKAYLLSGSAQRFRGELSLSSAGHALEGFSGFGSALAGFRGLAAAEALGDIDSDGYGDFVVGASSTTDVVYSIFYGAASVGTQPLRQSEADATIVSPTGRAFVHSLGDWDGNGAAELGLTIEVQAGEERDFRSPTNPTIPLYNEYYAIAGTSARFAGRYTAPAYRPDLPRPKLDANFQPLEYPAQNVFAPRPIGDVDGDGRGDLTFTIVYGPNETGASGGTRAWLAYGGPLPNDARSIH